MSKKVTTRRDAFAVAQENERVRFERVRLFIRLHVRHWRRIRYRRRRVQDGHFRAKNGSPGVPCVYEK